MNYFIIFLIFYSWCIHGLMQNVQWTYIYAQTVIISFQTCSTTKIARTKLEYFNKAATRDLFHRLRWTIRNPFRRDPLTNNTKKSYLLCSNSHLLLLRQKEEKLNNVLDSNSKGRQGPVTSTSPMLHFTLTFDTPKIIFPLSILNTFLRCMRPQICDFSDKLSGKAFSQLYRVAMTASLNCFVTFTILEAHGISVN